MEKLRSLFHNIIQNSEAREIENRTEIKTDNHPSSENVSHISTVHVKKQDEMKVIDPAVADFFKDFPEPYKTKAITRFSSREGLYRWDFIRDAAMKNEFQSASKGVFLEDKREFTQKLQRHEEWIREARQMESEKEEIIEPREPSALEKAIRSTIPVHEDETLTLKLFQTVNFSLLGILVLWSGITLKKRKPTIPTWQLYMTAAGCSYVCAYLQVTACYRLMDWGPFDRRLDNRDAMTKTKEEIKDFFSSVADSFTTKGKDDS